MFKSGSVLTRGLLGIVCLRVVMGERVGCRVGAGRCLLVLVVVFFMCFCCAAKSFPDQRRKVEVFVILNLLCALYPHRRPLSFYTPPTRHAPDIPKTLLKDNFETTLSSSRKWRDDAALDTLGDTTLLVPLS